MLAASTVVNQNAKTAYSRAFTISNEVPNVGKTKSSYVVKLKKDEDGRFVLKCANLQGVVTDGATLDEAIRNVIEAIDLVLEERGLKEEYNIHLIDS